MTSLKQAQDEMVKANSAYRGQFAKAYKHFGYKDEDLFATYIQFISENTKQWLQETVPTWVDKSNVDKQYNGIKQIWEHPESYPTLAPLISDEVKTHLVKAVPALLNDLTGIGKRFTPKKRKGKEQENPVQDNDDSDSVLTEETYPDNPIIPGYEPKPITDVVELQEKIRHQEADLLRFQEIMKKQKRMLELLLAVVSEPLKDNHMFGPIKDFIMEAF